MVLSPKNVRDPAYKSHRLFPTCPRRMRSKKKCDTTVNFSKWYNYGTKEAFLMHVTAVLDAIKKRGHFKDYEKTQKAYVEQEEAVKSAKAGLALLDGASKGPGKLSKKSKKAKEAKAKSKEAKAKSKEADGATKVQKTP
jgi:hypothetical protein